MTAYNLVLLCFPRSARGVLQFKKDSVKPYEVSVKTQKSIVGESRAPPLSLLKKELLPASFRLVRSKTNSCLKVLYKFQYIVIESLFALMMLLESFVIETYDALLTDFLMM